MQQHGDDHADGYRLSRSPYQLLLGDRRHRCADEPERLAEEVAVEVRIPNEATKKLKFGLEEEEQLPVLLVNGVRLGGSSLRVGRVSLTYAEARARAARISGVAYRIDLDLTSRESFGCRTTVTFDLEDPRPPPSSSSPSADDLRLTVNGAPVDQPAYDGDADHRCTTCSRTTRWSWRRGCPTSTTATGCTPSPTRPTTRPTWRRTPGMDLAHRVFACFDQPDLKAPITLTVQAPEDWTVIANGRADRRARTDVRTLHDHAADLDVPLHRLRRALALAHLGARRAAVRLARPGVARPPSSTATSTNMREVTERCFDFYTADLRRAVPVRLLRPGDGPGPQLGRHGDRRAA